MCRPPKEIAEKTKFSKRQNTRPWQTTHPLVASYVWDNHHILNFGNPLKSGGAVIGSGLALLGIVVMIGIVADDCEGLTMSTVDHFPLINAG